MKNPGNYLYIYPINYQYPHIHEITNIYVSIYTYISIYPESYLYLFIQEITNIIISRIISTYQGNN